MDPLVSLVVVAALLALAAVAFWPGRGAAWSVLRGREAARRVAVEDALKHLWDAEYRGVPATLQSLAGALGLDGSRAAEVVHRLERLELVEHDGARLRLTAAGQRDAVRVVRIHRLWERYLADRTGLAEAEWHAEAERREHRMSDDEAAALEARLGFPRFDPHGDPIPMPTGEVPPPHGVPLLTLEPGALAEIVHVEDEPDAVYAQLVAAGLAPGTRVRLIESTPRRVRLATAADEVVLAPIVAANLSVAPLAAAADAAEPEVPVATLSSLAVGESAPVVGLAPACRGAQRRRLLDLGVVPGTVVASEMRAPGGDPTAYRIRGALIALRREQADLVHVARPAAAAAGGAA